MRCELCGREIIGRAYLGVVDRATLILCEKCSRRAAKIYGPLGGGSARRKVAPTPKRPRRSRLPEMDVVEDYAERVRGARERIGLTRATLAAMLGVKVSVVRRIEEGTLIPPLDLARKLEKTLRIRLLEPVGEEEYSRGETREWSQTLGDVAVFKE